MRSVLACIKMRSQVTDERKAFIRTMKDGAAQFVEDAKKVSVGGYGLKECTTDAETETRIVAILGIAMADQPIGSIAFTRHEVTGVSRSMRCEMFTMYSNS